MRNFQQARCGSRSYAMRHKYGTRAVVLGRGAAREAGLTLTLLTEDMGLVRARAEGLRKPGAKLASALQTLCECEVTLLRGREGWRLSGALLTENHFNLLSPEARAAAARVAGLFLRLMPPDAHEPGFFALYRDFVHSLADLTAEQLDTAECSVALSLLVMLGLDSGPVDMTKARNEIVVRINRGIAASGL